MAHQNQEIEIRIPLSLEEYTRIKTIMKGSATHKATTNQIDSYYTPAHRNFLEPAHPKEWLSIRKRGEKTTLNYKNFYFDDSGKPTHCDEWETVIDNPDMLTHLFTALGFTLLVTVEKTRELFALKNELEVCLDQVTGLGHFIEIEACADFGSVEQARERLLLFAQELGLDPLKESRSGYAYLIAKKNGLV